MAKHEPELEIPQVVKGEGLHDCMTRGCFSFQNSDFAPAKNFIKKNHPGAARPGATGARHSRRFIARIEGGPDISSVAPS
jgi:hypothetical protein